MNNRWKRILLPVMAASMLLLTGCAGTISNMRELPVSEAPAVPEPGKAMIVFLRPSGIGFGVQSTVYEVRNDEPLLVGIVAAKTRVAYQVSPGRYLFMTVGENADFMSAEVAAGRTYFVKVEPRMGMWKARFGLEPYRQKDFSGAAFTGELNDCKPVAKNEASEAWFQANLASIRQKRGEYYADWLKQDAALRPHLAPEDGR